MVSDLPTAAAAPAPAATDVGDDRNDDRDDARDDARNDDGDDDGDDARDVAAWTARAAALTPRGDLPQAVVWRDVVLGPLPPPAAESFRVALVAALSSALSSALPSARAAPSAGPGRALGPPIPGVPAAFADPRRPRIGVILASPAGPVTATVAGPHLLDRTGLTRLLAQADEQVRHGRLDLRFLAAPEATVTVLDQAHAAAVPAAPGILLGLSAGSPTARVVPVGDEGIGVRSVVSLAASAAPHHVDPLALAHLLARVAAALAPGP